MSNHKETKTVHFINQVQLPIPSCIYKGKRILIVLENKKQIEALQPIIADFNFYGCEFEFKEASELDSLFKSGEYKEERKRFESDYAMVFSDWKVWKHVKKFMSG